MQRPGHDVHHRKPVKLIVKEIMGAQGNSLKAIKELIEQGLDIESCPVAKHKGYHDGGKNLLG